MGRNPQEPRDSAVRIREAAACIVCAVAGFILGTINTRQKPPRLEPPAVAILHQDGSRTLERTNEPPPAPLPEPPGTIARTRAATIELDPIPTRSEIQIDLVSMKDGTQRITAKGPGITGGKDFAIIPAQTVEKWTAGPAWDGKQVGIVAIRTEKTWSVGILTQRDRITAFVGFRF